MPKVLKMCCLYRLFGEHSFNFYLKQVVSFQTSFTNRYWAKVFLSETFKQTFVPQWTITHVKGDFSLFSTISFSWQLALCYCQCARNTVLFQVIFQISICNLAICAQFLPSIGYLYFNIDICRYKRMTAGVSSLFEMIQFIFLFYGAMMNAHNLYGTLFCVKYTTRKTIAVT